MKMPFMVLVTGLIAGGLCLAQDSSQTPAANPPAATQPSSSPTSGPANPSANQLKIAPGSVIPVQLTKTVDAKKMKTGDPVEAKVTQDLKTTSGDVMVPKDTKVIGHVTEAQPRSKDQKESQVGIAFDHAVVKGSDVQLPMSIQAVVSQATLHADQQNSPAPNAGVPSGGGGAQPGRAPSMSPGQSSQPATDAEPAATSDTNPKPQGPITANTQGVVGISNLTLSSGSSAQGSVLSSDKNNVKLDSGTLILLRVNQ